MTEREQQILALVRENPLISQVDIATRLGISRSAVAGHIMRLVAKGVIKGRGYVVNDAPFAVIIGGANMDICGKPAGKLRMQDSNPGKVDSSPGGVARNIAENLARLGVDCRLIAAVGNDHHGNLLLKQGQTAGIDMGYMLRLDSSPTSTYVSVLDESGDMLVAINDMSIVEELRPGHLQLHEQMLRQSSLIIADTNLPDASLAYLGGTFNEQPLFVDTVSVAKANRIKPYLDTVHTLKASRSEAEELCGIRAPGNKKLSALADWFHSRGVERLFITLGPGGVFYSDGDAHGLMETGAKSKNVKNASGAGDAFVAGIAYSWLAEWPLEKSTRFAMSAAQVALSHRSTINPAMSAAAVNRIYEANYVA
ncbi:MAG: PfkB family carbohydrate kinase [Proteobacteria bacterium]|nr:PfkB family carbohydrate kinase [Pseudomonadota bacterium]